MYQLWISKSLDVKWEGHFPKSESIHKQFLRSHGNLKENRKRKKGIINSQFGSFLVPKVIKSRQKSSKVIKSHQKSSDISFFLHKLILLKQITSVFE